MKWSCVGNTGKGKTLSIVLVILDMLNKDPEKEAYLNFHINHPRCHYTPIMFLPFSRLKNSIICFDDIDDESELKRFIKTCAKQSRKTFLELMFTCQYYSMIPRKLRKMMDKRIFPDFDKNKDILTIKIVDKEKGLEEPKIYYNITKTIEKTKIYDTNEVVDDPTDNDVINEIARISETPRDIEKNLMLYSGNRALRKQLYKEILEICDFNKEEREAKQKKKLLKKQKKEALFKKQKSKLIRYLVREVDLDTNKDAIYGSLYYKTDTFNKKNLINETDFNEIIMRSKSILLRFAAQNKKKNKEFPEGKNNNFSDNELAIIKESERKTFNNLAEELNSNYSTIYTRIKNAKINAKKKYDSYIKNLT